MPSAIRKKSYGSVTIYSVDKELVTQALNGFVAACRQRPEVLAVVLFGSFAGNWFGGQPVTIPAPPPVISTGKFSVGC